MSGVPSFHFDREGYLKAVGADMKRARLERGLSREELADLAGVHPNTIGGVERGDHDVNSGTKCWILAALGARSVIMETDADFVELEDDESQYPRADVQAMADSEIVRIIGNAIRNRREGIGMSLDELARRSGVHRNTLWNIERGLVSCSGSSLHCIYIALGVRKATPLPAKLGLELDDGIHNRLYGA